MEDPGVSAAGDAGRDEELLAGLGREALAGLFALDFLSLLGRFLGGDAAPVPTRFPEGLTGLSEAVALAGKYGTRVRVAKGPAAAGSLWALDAAIS